MTEGWYLYLLAPIFIIGILMLFDDTLDNKD